MAIIKSINAQQKNEILTQHFYESSFKTRENTNFYVPTMKVVKDKKDNETPAYHAFLPLRNVLITASNMDYFARLVLEFIPLHSLITTDVIYSDSDIDEESDMMDTKEHLRAYIGTVIDRNVKNEPFISSWGQEPFIIEKTAGYLIPCYNFISDEQAGEYYKMMTEYIASVREEFIENTKEYVKHTNMTGRGLSSPTINSRSAERDYEYYEEMYRV